MFQTRLNRVRRALEFIPSESTAAQRLRELIAEIEAEARSDGPDIAKARARLQSAEAIVDVEEARRG